MKISRVLLAVLLMQIQLAYSRDVSTQQTAYNNALKQFERAEERYKADADAVADLERDIERRKKQLAEEQKKLDISKSKYLEAKEKLDQAQMVLDKAWKE